MSGARHTIRLGGGWRVPSDQGTAWVRGFGRPAGLGPTDRVLLVWEWPAGAAPAPRTLNGAPLASAREVDVTGLLRDRNELVLTAAAPAAGADGRRWPRLPPSLGQPVLVIVAGD